MSEWVREGRGERVFKCLNGKGKGSEEVRLYGSMNDKALGKVGLVLLGVGGAVEEEEEMGKFTRLM